MSLFAVRFLFVVFNLSSLVVHGYVLRPAPLQSPCDASEPSEPLMAALEQFYHDDALASNSKQRRYVNNGSRSWEADEGFRSWGLPTDRVVVPTYFHVVTGADIGWLDRLRDYLTGSKTAKHRPPSDDELAEQLRYINGAFEPAGFTFAHVATTRTVNAAWAVAPLLGNALGTAQPMKRSLRRGAYSALNVYFVDRFDAGFVAGHCSLPTTIGDATGSPERLAEKLAADGCVVASSTVPGPLAIHEVAHWYGLLHVFQGFSCWGKGDYVADTPPRWAPSFACAQVTEHGFGRCNGDSGAQEEDEGGFGSNYMDYSGCLFQKFTDGQMKRMRDVWQLFRNDK